MKLKELHINNFKFFPKQDAKSPLLKIDEKNLLIYGENGSGKSTIYWALYTLLESSFKDSDDKVEKYFVKGGESGLVNIHAPKKDKAFIKAVLSGGAASKEYLVSGDSATIQAIRANSSARESGMSSDFINYRVLFKLHHAKHTSDNNLFDWFEDEILPYVRKTVGASTFSQRIALLKNGPSPVKNIEGEWVFPNPSMALETNESIREAVRKDYKFYRSWERSIKSWGKDVKGFLKVTNGRANQILQNDFKQSLVITLELTTPKYNILSTPIISDGDLTNLNWKEPEIRIKVVKYLGKKNVVKRAHSFLNEAKWTAIGLSIRLAILEDITYRPSPVDLKCLVLDDMLLSLDMSNRDIVLDLLLKRYVVDYQLLLMTHDKFFFELAQYKINQLRQTNWKFLEMFDQNDKPLIIETTSKIKKAWTLFYSKDLDLAANTLRKAAEKLCKAYLTRQERLNVDYTPMILHNMLLALQTKGLANGLDAATLSKLIEYKDRILNPNSHYDIETPLFETELENAISAFEKISIDTGIVI